MNALTIALASGAALWLGYRFYGRFITRRVFGAGDLPDEAVPSRARRDGVDFVPTRRSVLFGHHYVTIAGAGPIVGPAVAVTWGWLPALAVGRAGRDLHRRRPRSSGRSWPRSATADARSATSLPTS